MRAGGCGGRSANAEEAVEYFKAYRRDAAFATRLAQSDGALIAPDAGMLGPAVFLIRDGVAGEWSYPLFYQVLNPDLGLPEAKTDLAFLFLNRDGVERMMAGAFQLKRGGEVSFTAVGPGIEESVGTEIVPDVVVFSSKGDANFVGSRMSPMPACTEAYYGRPVSPVEVIRGDLPADVAADQLREALLVLAPPRVVPR